MKRAVIAISVSGIVISVLALSGFSIVANHPALVGVVVGVIVAMIVDPPH